MPCSGGWTSGGGGGNVLVFHYPYEEDAEILKSVLKRHGTVLGVHYQSYQVSMSVRVLGWYAWSEMGPSPVFLISGGTCVKFGIMGRTSFVIFVGRATSLATVPLRASAVPATKKGIMLETVQMLEAMIGGILQLMMGTPLKLWILSWVRVVHPLKTLETIS